MKLAKLYDNIISEGVYDPFIFKAIIMAGGPGSGKSFVTQELFGIPNNVGFSFQGLKTVNSDTEFEHFLKKLGINPADLIKTPEEGGISDVDRDFIRGKAKETHNKRTENYLKGRLGIIIDTTSDEISKAKKRKEKLEELGYDTYMVYVNTSLETAQARNLKRGRRLKPKVVEEIWHAVQNNKEALKNLYSPNFIIVNNDKKLDPGEQFDALITKAVKSFIKRPITNPIAKEWIKQELEKKKRG